MTEANRSACMPRWVLNLLLVFAAFGALYNLAALVPLMRAFAADGLPLTLVNRDFANVWMAGHLVLNDATMELFAQDAYMTRLREAFGADYPIHAWSYPPHALLLAWPFGLLDYRAGLILYWGVGLAAFLFAVVTSLRSWGEGLHSRLLLAAVFAFAMLGLETAQNGFFTAALLLLGVAWARDRVVLAALAFALLTTKPQLGILMPLWMLAERNWRLLGWTAALSAAFLALSVGVFGIRAWVGYIEGTVPYQQLVMTDWQGVFLPMMATTFGAGRVLGLDAATAYSLHWPIAALSLVLVGVVLLRLEDASLRLLAVISGTFLVSPYAFSYDMGALVVVAATASADDNNALGWRLRALLGFTAVLPPMILRFGLSGLPITPLVLLLVLLGLAWSARRPRLDRPATSLPCG